MLITLDHIYPHILYSHLHRCNFLPHAISQTITRTLLKSNIARLDLNVQFKVLLIQLRNCNRDYFFVLNFTTNRENTPECKTTIYSHKYCTTSLREEILIHNI